MRCIPAANSCLFESDLRGRYVSDKLPEVWDLDPHTHAKHVILRRYLHAWLPIIAQYNSRVVFVDGFAGPGVYTGGEDGSPVIALRALIEHAHVAKIKANVQFLFFEVDAQRAARLAQIVEPYRTKLPANASYTVQQGNYAELLGGLFDALDANGRQLAPSLVFIDPFGVSSVPMSLVRRILATPSCEVMINFMISYAHRFIAASEFEPHLDAIFGTPEWRAGRSMTGPDRMAFLRNLYVSELIRADPAGSARYVRKFTMLDKTNKPIYDLVFATNHAVGIDRMKDAMWKVDASGGERFSDATDPDQPTLLSGAELHDEGLLHMLRTSCAGQAMPWREVEEYIRNSPYRVLKRPLQKAAKDPCSGIKIASTNRGISDDAIVTFRA